MDEKPLYSVRMRASRGGLHVSGAERIVPEGSVPHVLGELAARALSHERGIPDTLSITAGSLEGRELVYLPALRVTDVEAVQVGNGRDIALRELTRAGVSETAALKALELVGAPGVMPGAAVMDARTGARLDPEPGSGVRARCMDFDPASIDEVAETLKRHGLDRTHLKEALVLATKAANAPGAVAELCVSDDPSYVTGYVASRARGYVRITPLKVPGDLAGGRVFFMDGGAFEYDEYVAYMRETPVLVTGPVVIRGGF